MIEMNRERWDRLMRALALEPGASTFDELLRCYRARGRHYHTDRHVDACLKHLDQHAELADSAAEIELALWFHDAIYQPLRSDNELKSAEWAVRFVRQAGGSSDLAGRVRGLVMATVHPCVPQTPDQRIMVDVDLSILGAEPRIYDGFESAVRKEYWMVPGFIYRRKRAELLQSFLGREWIYNHPVFRKQWEARACENLTRALTALVG